MTREFEIAKEVELDATPRQVWEAITTAEGTAGWLFTTEDVQPDGPGVITWDPPRRLAVQTPVADDGSTQAFEYLIEARDGGTAVLRFVHSGVLGDNWNDEYEDMMGAGWDMYLHTLAEYLKYFSGRQATFVTVEGPAASAEESAWAKLPRALGLPGTPAVGEKVRLTPEGFPPIEGVVDYTGPSFLGVRADDAIYRFHGRSQLGAPVAIGHHLYRPGVDQEKERDTWRSWLERAFA
ncbi:SRPBCC family protein [Amycolatopsis pigmentata]|uniref:SRPBCC domain-containing protein n=1 Tax=Amycolatopsis pigmentata TaxID=450801 RepID=A0ABW5G3Q4_9PSEU